MLKVRYLTNAGVDSHKLRKTYFPSLQPTFYDPPDVVSHVLNSSGNTLSLPVTNRSFTLHRPRVLISFIVYHFHSLNYSPWISVFLLSLAPWEARAPERESERGRGRESAIFYASGGASRAS